MDTSVLNIEILQRMMKLKLSLSTTGRSDFQSMNIPTITSISNALKIYYSNSELGNKEITALFGRRSSATMARLKRIVKDEMSAKNIPSYGANKVNTTIAFDVWGIDVKDLEKRMKKMRELSL